MQAHDVEPTRSGAFRKVWIGIHAIAAAAIIAAACSSGGGDTATTEPAATEPAVTEPAATQPSGTEPATTDAAETTVPTVDADLVSFANDVQPILEDNCASCHVENGPGTVHLNMATAEGVTGFDASYIDTVVSVGFMPPWPAADGDVAFHDDRRLDDESKATLAAWAEQGGVLDVDPSTPIVPARPTQTVIDRDIVLQGEPYKGDLSDPDDYRCQIHDPEFTELSYVQGFGIEADRTEVVHHGLVFKASADIRSDAEARDAADDAAGWSCTGLAGLPGVTQVLSWAPGQDPTALPEDTGIVMEAGDFFVVQLHYHYEPELLDLAPDESTLVVDVADADVVAANGGFLDPINLSLYLAPAEIPCSTEEVGPLCDRDAALADLGSREGTLAGGIAGVLMRSCGTSVEDYADMTDGIASATCDQHAYPGQIVSIWGHEHEIGKSFTMTLNPDTPDEKVLLHIPNWDFDWQLDYRPIEDIVLEQDDIIRVECVWDRSRIPDDAEPRYVLWAEGTNDEMCYSQIITRPAE